MSTEIITAATMPRFWEVAEPLAVTYKVAFAGAPWFEVSRCPNTDCEINFSRSEPEELCNCGEPLVEAYDAGLLTDSWAQQLINERALFELETDNSIPLRATLARPTTSEELFERKYVTVPRIQAWLKAMLPQEFVWIEDTFADRTRRPSGNLRARGETLQLICQQFGSVAIATRTLSEAVIAATVRDAGLQTYLYIGEAQAGMTQIAKLPRERLGRVPDRRSLLVVGPMGGGEQ